MKKITRRAPPQAATHGLPPRTALALAGGGPLGAIYEIGALCALDEALSGLKFNDLHAYIGVSSGGFIAAGLANGITPRELCASFIENTGTRADVFDPSVLVRPAWGEYAKRLTKAPSIAAQAVLRFALNGGSMMAAMERLGSILPTGIFSNAMIDAQLRQQFSVPGRSNDFRKLKRKLVLVATDLDSGDSTEFGQPGLDHVPISKAVQASAALPGLFPPVEIDGRYYVDGALKKTLHASVLLDEGVDVLICLNPLVPFDSTRAPARKLLSSGEPVIPKIADGGLPVVLSQTFRTLIHSRLELGMKGYERSHPNTTILLFEPDHRDPEMFLANTFSYRQRRALAEHAYQQTRKMLRERRAALSAQLAPHGISIQQDVLDDVRRTLVSHQRASASVRNRSGRAIHKLEQTLNDLEQAIQPRKDLKA